MSPRLAHSARAEEGKTMQAQQKIAVAGATGRVGRHIVEVLAGPTFEDWLTAPTLST